MSFKQLPETLSSHNVRFFDAAQLIDADETPVDSHVVDSITRFVKKAVGSTPGEASRESVEAFVNTVAEVERLAPLYGGTSFSYPAVSNVLPELPRTTPDITITSATSNLLRTVEDIGPDNLAAISPRYRKRRAVEWSAPIDDTYEIRVRGASGASTASLDFGLGYTLPSDEKSAYHELWRCGTDTEYPADGITGGRIIRTGSGVKPDDKDKKQMFDKFRKSYDIMPQKLLALVAMHVLHEQDPDYVVALTTTGAQQVSTLGKSSGACDYSGIFESVGFEPSEDGRWSIIEDYNDGFYEALERASLRASEVAILDRAVTAINEDIRPAPRSLKLADVAPPVRLLQDDQPETLEREFSVYLPEHRIPPFIY